MDFLLSCIGTDGTGVHKVRLGYDTITYYTIFCNLLMKSKIQVYNYRREQCLCE